MPVKQPQPGDLEPIEKASRDEIAALQLERLKATLRNAYENVLRRAKFVTGSNADHGVLTVIKQVLDAREG